MELWKYYRILRKRKWLIIIGTFICVGIVLGALKLSPQKYEGFTTVTEVSPGGEQVTIFQTPYQPFDPKLRLANLTQLVKSNEVMLRSYAQLSELGVHIDRDKFRGMIDVSPVLDSSYLRVRAVSEDHVEALTIATIVTDEFVRYYNEINHSGPARSREFIESELPKAKARLDEAREQLRVYKESTNSSMLSQQANSVLQQLTQFETSLAQYEIASSGSAAKLNVLESQMQEFPETRQASRVMSNNPVYQQLEVELAKQEIQLQGELRQRTPEHPNVQALQRQIEESRSKLLQTAQTILNSTTEASDPTKDRLIQEYTLTLVENSSAKAAASAVAQVVNSLRPQLSTLPEKEMRLAQLTLEQDAAQNTYSLLRVKRDEAAIKEKELENVSSVRIVDPARVQAVNSNVMMKMILAILLSPIFCAGVALLLNYLDNTIRTPAEAEELLRLPVFAVVPIAKSHSLASDKHLPAIDASYQMLSTNLLIGQEDMEGNTVLVASAEPDVGRSITAVNLAITLAKDGARVIVVDSDLRQPSVHRILNVDNERGLSNVLAGKLAVKDAVQPTSIKDLLVIPSGPMPSNPVRLFRSPEMAKFVSTVNELADFVIFDSPAGITFPDSSLLAALVKNVVIVHAAGSVSRGAETEFRNRLEQVGANLIGVVLNMVRPEDSHGYYHFRSAYEELMRGGKDLAAVGGKRLPSIAKGDEDSADKTDSTG